MSDVIERAEAWISADPDPTTRAELRALIDAGATAELEERMNGTLAFGTAGLRGAVEAGSNRMNRAVVIRTTRGLADHLLARYGGVPSTPVVIGRDARLSSPQFMADAIGVLVAAGIHVRYWEGDTPTPLVAYAGKMLDACASIVVTASHNPPQDNGYKVYADNGAQIVPPIDGQIAAAIDAVGPANQVPMDEGALDGTSALAVPIERQMFDDYLAAIAALRVPALDRPPIRIVYTPMHGVGWQSVRAALRRAGHDDLHAVPEQVEPDGYFPTVAFPNPEEPGALDLANALAARLDADVVIANDPDADRLAVTLPTADGWEHLSGNQIGQLLADYVLRNHRSDSVPIVINSIVSSPMLASIAAEYGARFETTLTGFKWIANAAMDLEQAGVGEFVFGYEEALGYTVGPLVRDKDGVSAALVFADLVADCKAAGLTVHDRLAELYRRHGLWISTQKSVVRPGSAGLAEIADAMQLLARSQPDELAGVAVTGVTDYRGGADQRPRWLPASALVVLDLADSTRVLIRPSGTEPKLKIYVDARSTLTGDVRDAVEALTARADEVAGAVAAFLGFD
jgi:phosphomannomutase